MASGPSRNLLLHLTQAAQASSSGRSPSSAEPEAQTPPTSIVPPVPGQQESITQCATKFTKLELPAFSGPPEPAAINAWLGCCDDAFFASYAWNDAAVMSPQLRIVLAGMKLLPSWSNFQDFVLQLQAVRNALTSAGLGFTTSDSIFKKALAPVLEPSPATARLGSAIGPSLAYKTIKVGALVNLMSRSLDVALSTRRGEREGRRTTESGWAGARIALQPGTGPDLPDRA